MQKIKCLVTKKLFQYGHPTLEESVQQQLFLQCANRKRAEAGHGGTKHEACRGGDELLVLHQLLQFPRDSGRAFLLEFVTHRLQFFLKCLPVIESAMGAFLRIVSLVGTFLLGFRCLILCVFRLLRLAPQFAVQRILQLLPQRGILGERLDQGLEFIDFVSLGGVLLSYLLVSFFLYSA